MTGSESQHAIIVLLYRERKQVNVSSEREHVCLLPNIGLTNTWRHQTDSATVQYPMATPITGTCTCKRTSMSPMAAPGVSSLKGIGSTRDHHD
jgi:hypothetical protein